MHYTKLKVTVVHLCTTCSPCCQGVVWAPPQCCQSLGAHPQHQVWDSYTNPTVRLVYNLLAREDRVSVPMVVSQISSAYHLHDVHCCHSAMHVTSLRPPNHFQWWCILQFHHQYMCMTYASYVSSNVTFTCCTKAVHSSLWLDQLTEKSNRLHNNML